MKKRVFLFVLGSLFFVSCSSVKMINVYDNEYSSEELSLKMSVISEKDDVFKIYKLEDGGYILCDVVSAYSNGLNINDLETGIVLTAEEASDLAQNLTKLIDDCNGYTKENGVFAEIILNEKVKESELNATYVSQNNSIFAKSESSATVSTERIALKIQAYSIVDFMGKPKLAICYYTRSNYMTRETSINKIISLRDLLLK